MTRIVVLIATMLPPRKVHHFATALHSAGAAQPSVVVHVVQVVTQPLRQVSPVLRQPFLQPGFVHAASQSVCVLVHAAPHVVASDRQLAFGTHGVVSMPKVSAGMVSLTAVSLDAVSLADVSETRVSARASVPAFGSNASKSCVHALSAAKKAIASGRFKTLPGARIRWVSW
jgi:hypothetical protein